MSSLFTELIPFGPMMKERQKLTGCLVDGANECVYRLIDRVSVIAVVCGEHSTIHCVLVHELQMAHTKHETFDPMRRPTTGVTDEALCYDFGK